MSLQSKDYSKVTYNQVDRDFSSRQDTRKYQPIQEATKVLLRQYLARYQHSSSSSGGSASTQGSRIKQSLGIIQSSIG